MVDLARQLCSQQQREHNNIAPLCHSARIIHPRSAQHQRTCRYRPSRCRKARRPGHSCLDTARNPRLVSFLRLLRS